MSKSRRSSKDIERRGFELLKKHLAKELGDDFCIGKSDVADALLKYRGNEFHIEMKASTGALDHNIRFAHQTVTKARGKDLIVALVSNLDNARKRSFEFFRLGALKRYIEVEPRFIVKKKRAERHADTIKRVLEGKRLPIRLPYIRRRNRNNHWRLSIEWSNPPRASRAGRV
jgi:hypothetical protein